MKEVLRKGRFLLPEPIIPLSAGTISCICESSSEAGGGEALADQTSRFGGTNGTQWFNDVWSYDPRINTWTQLDCIGYIPAPREGHSAALVGDVMYIFGGRTEEGADLGDLAAFRITSRRWYTFQNMGPSPSPRSGHSMTAFDTQIVVLAGEPSSAPRDAGELSLVYILDTSKIRYPNDQQIQQTPPGERVQGNRRPSGERGAVTQLRGPSRDVSNGPGDGLRRQFSGSRENINAETSRPGAVGGMLSGARAPDVNVSNSPPAQGPNSRLPRASAAQASSGPPPQQQSPPPRANGPVPSLAGPRSRTPTKENRGFGPQTDAVRGPSLEGDSSSTVVSSMSRENPRPAPSIRNLSQGVNGRQTPNQQFSTQSSRVAGVNTEDTEPRSMDEDSAKAQPLPQEPVFDDGEEFLESTGQQQRAFSDSSSNTNTPSPPKDASPRNQQSALEQEVAWATSKQEELSRELERVRSRNAWYASELALARKAGYQCHSAPGPALSQRATPSFGDEDKQLIEALIAMRARLAEVQGSIDSRENAAAQELGEMEQQRDVAVREAAFAKAKLAAHSASTTGTPLSEAMSREVSSDDRSDDLGRKLATALAAQAELRAKVSSLTAEVDAEKRIRQLAEETADAARKRVAELDQSRDPAETESLRMELYEVTRTAREEAASKSEAHTKLQLLEVDKDDLTRQLEEALESTKQHKTMVVSLRDAVGASSDKASLLERKLDEEKSQREAIEHKLLELKAEHEERTAELETTTRKLRDAEELVETHASEAQTHRQVLLTGLEKISTRGPDDKVVGSADERVSIMRRQMEDAHALVRKSQADADVAAEKLRRAEERIAGLEAYQEQSSREGLATRKQLQDAVQESQAAQSKWHALQQQLESHQRDASALSVQYGALKELLEERGISALGKNRNLDSPSSRLNTPDQARVRELEQQLHSSVKEQEELKSSFENREQETEKVFRDRIEQLEQDYQSAVHYVKGTEKMLERLKNELIKYKTQNARLQTELEGSHHSRSRSSESEAATEWERERQSLRREIGEMQESVKESMAQLERQMEDVQAELYAVQEERDHFRQGHEEARQELTHTMQQARAELEQLKNENSMLESRALDAEQKVTLLLDQVNTSVGNYRRQSQNMHSNGHHLRNVSAASTTNPLPHPNANTAGFHSQSNSFSESAFPPPPEGLNVANNRNSFALDSLASELESLRSHWEGTHRNYRHSNQFDFERSPTSGSVSGGDAILSDSLASWRKRLDAEEAGKKGRGGDGDEESVASLSEKGRGSSPVEGPNGLGGKIASGVGPAATESSRAKQMISDMASDSDGTERDRTVAR